MIIKEHQTILVSIDFSDQSLNALKQSYSIAKHTKSKILLLYVSSNPEKKHEDDLLNLAETTRKESTLEVETVVEKGDLYEVIIKKVEPLNIALVIMGIGDHVKFKSRFGGSTIHKFINVLTCPIITIREHMTMDGIKNILIPFDLSPESREKVPFAVQLARFYGADIRIISIFPPNDDSYENKILPYLQQVKKFIKQEGVNCTNKTIPSTMAAESILEYAYANECGIIMQMNQKDLSISEKFSGTVGQKILEISKIPIMTIHPMKRESTNRVV